MASLRTRERKDGTTAFYVLLRIPREDGKSKQTSELFDTADDALAFLALCKKHGDQVAQKILTAQDSSEVGAITLRDLLDRYNASRVGVTPGTLQRYQRHARDFSQLTIADLPVDSITRTHISDWVASKARAGKAEKTIKDQKQYLSGAFAWGLDQEPPLVARNPCRRIAVPRTERREMVALEPREIEALLAVVDEHWKPLILTLLGTGLRVGEATALQVRDLHLTDSPPTLTVSRGWTFTTAAQGFTGAPKTVRGRRTLSLPIEVVDALRKVAAGRSGEDWVFLGANGKPITHRRQTLSRHWARWVKESGITKKPRLHDCRHTHASILINNGVPLTVVQHRLGHASIKVTSDTYSHVMPESQVVASRAASLAFAVPAEVPQIEA